MSGSQLHRRLLSLEESIAAVEQKAVLLWREDGESREEAMNRHFEGNVPDKVSITFIRWKES